MFSKNNAIYLELSSIIKEQVLTGDLKGKVPSERELAEKYSVNFKTVNKAISALVGEGVLYRVRGKGAFVKENAHENLKSSVKNIGLAVYNMKWLNNSFYSEILAGMGEIVQKNGHNLQFLTTNKNSEEAHKSLYYMDTWAQGKFDGMIIAGEEVDESDIVKLNSRKYPFVLLGNRLPRKRLNWVDIDNYKGGYDAAMHLLDLGHEHIAFLQGFDSKTDKERIAGCREALKKKNLKLSKEYIKSSYFEEDKAYIAIKELLTLKPRSTAIIASDDVMAVNAMQAIKDEGLSVPRDISVIGFNDSLLASKVSPPLTSLKISMYEMGKAAIEILEKKFVDIAFKPIKKVFEPELVIRNSTELCSMSKNEEDIA
jgi:DNA-binding LacI/PurR family transcriptional regulator